MIDLSPPYLAIASEVTKTREDAKDDRNAWFRQIPLRSQCYDKIRGDYLNVFKVVEGIWRVCTKTAPFIFTLIAPESSYSGKEDEIIKLMIEEDFDTLKSPNIYFGIDSLENQLEKSVENNEGFSIICNLYNGLHGFVIEKRNDDCCFLYQSFFADAIHNPYTFDEFLKDENKHKVWSPKKLIKKLRKITSKELPDEHRIKAYAELFFCSNITSFKQKDTLYKNSIGFLITDTYSLRTNVSKK